MGNAALVPGPTSATPQDGGSSGDGTFAPPFLPQQAVGLTCEPSVPSHQAFLQEAYAQKLARFAVRSDGKPGTHRFRDMGLSSGTSSTLAFSTGTAHALSSPLLMSHLSLHTTHVDDGRGPRRDTLQSMAPGHASVGVSSGAVSGPRVSIPSPDGLPALNVFGFDQLLFFDVHPVGESPLFVSQRALCQQKPTTSSLGDFGDFPDKAVRHPRPTSPSAADVGLIRDLPNRGLQSNVRPTSDTISFTASGHTMTGVLEHSPPSTPPAPFPVFVKSYRLRSREPSRMFENGLRRIRTVAAALLTDIHPNVLPYARVDVVKKRMPALSRSWVDLTLEARLSQSCPMQDIERRWLVFQMLCSVAQLHSTGLSHGSLRLSNFLVTNADHLFLTDMSSAYKPYLLKYDTALTASDVFFDCTLPPLFANNGRDKPFYMAPERFLKRKFMSQLSCASRSPDGLQGTSNSDALEQAGINTGAPTPDLPYASDVYALGCCIAQVYQNGKSVMNLPDALALANATFFTRPSHGPPPGFVFPSDSWDTPAFSASSDANAQTTATKPWYLTQAMGHLSDPRAARLVEAMCHYDPSSRPRAVDCLYLGEELGLFPQFFFSFMLPLTAVSLHPLFQTGPLQAHLLMLSSRLYLGLPQDVRTVSRDACSDSSEQSSFGIIEPDPITLFQGLIDTLPVLPDWTSSSLVLQNTVPQRKRKLSHTFLSRSRPPQLPALATRDVGKCPSQATNHANGKPLYVRHNSNASAPLPFLSTCMGLWKERNGQFPHWVTSSALETFPFPWLTPERGRKWSSQLLTFWSRSLTRQLQNAEKRAEFWDIEGGHVGLFLHPDTEQLAEGFTMRNSLYAELFRPPDCKTARPSAFLSGTALFFEEQNGCVCLLNRLRAALEGTSSSIVGVALLDLLRQLLIKSECSISDAVLCERVCPMLMGGLAHPSVPFQCAVLRCLCAVFSTPFIYRILARQLPATYVTQTGVLTVLERLAVMEDPLCQETLMQSLSPILAFTARNGAQSALTGASRLHLLDFFRRLLTSAAPSVRIALLRAVHTLPVLMSPKDLTESVLPFLITFINSPQPRVRMEFCFHVFGLLKTSSVSSKHTNNDTTTDSFFWTVASALLPCFEAALCDAEPLVVEASLRGLTHFFSYFNTLKQQRSYGNRFKNIARQLARKIAPLLLHPDAAVEKYARATLRAICQMCFPDDVLASVVYLSEAFRPLVPESCAGLCLTLPNVLRYRHLPLRRILFYRLAFELHTAGNLPHVLSSVLAEVSQSSPCESSAEESKTLQDKSIDITSPGCKCLAPHIKQAFKPSVLPHLEQMLQRLLNKKAHEKNLTPSADVTSFQTESEEYSSNFHRCLYSIAYRTELSALTLQPVTLWTSPTSFVPQIPCFNDVTKALLGPLFSDHGFSTEKLCSPDVGRQISEWLPRDWRTRALCLPHGIDVLAPKWDGSDLARRRAGALSDRYPQSLGIRTQVLSSATLESGAYTSDGDVLINSSFPPEVNLLEAGGANGHVGGGTAPVEERTAPSTSSGTPAWKPFGALQGTLYEHQRPTSLVPGSYVALDTTSDGRLLVSCTLHPPTSTLTPSPAFASLLRAPAPLCPTVAQIWSTSRLRHQVENSHIASVTLQHPLVETAQHSAVTTFRVMQRSADLLLGFQDGSVATYSLSGGGICNAAAANNKHCDRLTLGPFRSIVSTSPAIQVLAFETLFEQVACSIHCGGQLRCWDFRSPTLSSNYQLPPSLGRPTCIDLSASQSAVHVGTAGGYLLTFDMRYQIPIQILRATLGQAAVPLLCLQTLESITAAPSVAVSFGGTQRREVCCLDPLTGDVQHAFLESTACYPSESPLQSIQCVSVSPVNCTALLTKGSTPNYDMSLCTAISTAGDTQRSISSFWSLSNSKRGVFQPNISSASVHDPFLLAGGSDGSLRYMSLTDPVTETYTIFGAPEATLTSYTQAIPVSAQQHEQACSSFAPPHLIVERPYHFRAVPSRRRSSCENCDIMSDRLGNTISSSHNPYLSGDKESSPCSSTTTTYPRRESSSSAPPFLDLESHHDAITAIRVLDCGQELEYTKKNKEAFTVDESPADAFREYLPLLVTSGRDGLIKLWH